jgi:hypothetical protein
MTAPEEVKTLVERFERNREAYRSSAYNETQLRREFIDPLVHKKELLQRQIDATDKQIDQLVYELYGLTDKEIGIVERGDEVRIEIGVVSPRFPQRAFQGEL